jgi:hypothetical protein
MPLIPDKAAFQNSLADLPLVTYHGSQLGARNRDSSRAADVGCHAPPRGVRMPRSFS